MKSIQLKCTLLSDIVISQSTATEGSQKTLDFIPGSSFLGLAASKLYKDTLNNDVAMQLFHNGQVMFGDAHPLIDNIRALRIPSYWFIAKGKNLIDGIYIPQTFPKNSGLQPKQCRTGFVIFKNDSIFIEYSPTRRFAIKSGYDREKRRSEDEKMFGYQSLEKGSEWGFEISYNERVVQEATIQLLIDAIKGNQQIGKSKTAEYGSVEIRPEAFETYNKTSERIDHCLIYTESRLMFLDKDGQPTYEPTPEQMGVVNGSIVWENSQIRTFQYAPFNSKRKTRDAERCVIEKGSVFYIQKDEGFKIQEGLLGSFVGEGFGKVLVNPDFLSTDVNGKIIYSFNKYEPSTSVLYTSGIILNPQNEVILSYLHTMQNQDRLQTQIYEGVNKFISDYSDLFINKGKFASQWGTIRSLAMRSRSKQDLVDFLFTQPNGYLVHGVAAEKWKDRNRSGHLERYIADTNEAVVIKTIINLAAEMAKKCKEDK